MNDVFEESLTEKIESRPGDMKWLSSLKGPCVRGVAGVVALGLVWSMGCRAPHEENVSAPPEIQHHTWWNFYEHGRALMRQGEYQQAAHDFEVALGLEAGARHGYPHELWRARTYGLHFIEGYFPHRELGICCYHLGQTDRALALLATSLKQEASGRAKYYLNLARQRKLAGGHPAAPVIKFMPVAQVLWTRDRKRMLDGTIEAEGYAAALNVNGKRSFIELAEPELNFHEELGLKAGTNIITVAAADLTGQAAQKQLMWIADWVPPALLIKEVRVHNAEWVLSGFLVDDHALASASADNKSIIQGVPGATTRSVPVTITIPFDKEVRLSAEDAAGNRLQVLLSANTLRQDGLVADAAPVTLYAMAASSDGVRADVPLAAPLPQSHDRLKPVLQLSDPAESHTVSDEEYFMEGKACDGGGLAHITINGEELLGQEHRGVKQSYFARRLPLDLGTNDFEVAAQDLAGNRCIRSCIVIRKKPSLLDDEFRLTVGIPPFPPDNLAMLRPLVKAYLEKEVARPPIRFRLLERHEGWDFILREQGLSLSELADPAAALRIHKMLPAEMLFMGHLLEDHNGVTIYVKVVETGQGEVLLSEDVYFDEAGQDLADKVGGLVLKVKQHFPVTSGEVLGVKGSEVTVSLSSAHHVRPGTRLIVAQKPRAASDLAENVLRQNGQLVELNVKNISHDRIVTDITPAAAASAIKKGDSVYVR